MYFSYISYDTTAIVGTRAYLIIRAFQARAWSDLGTQKAKTYLYYMLAHWYQIPVHVGMHTY